VADGLDRSHGGLVRRLRCHVSPKTIVIECDTMGPALSESVAALAKAVLLERVFRRKVRIRMHGQSGFSAGPTCSKTLRTSGIRLPAPRREAGAG
jgi:hypothetical protein